MEAQGDMSTSIPSLPHTIHFQVLEVFLFIWAPLLHSSLCLQLPIVDSHPHHPHPLPDALL